MTQQKVHQKRYWFIGIIVFTAAVVANAPASLLQSAFKQAGDQFHYAGIEGTIWSGVIRNVSVSGADLGDIKFKTRPSALLQGAIRAQVSLNGEDVFGVSEIGAGLGGGLQINDADLRLNLTRLSRRYAFMGAPIEGTATVQVEAFSINKNGCGRANGKIWTDVLKGPAKVFNGEAFDLSGPIECDEGIVKVMLAGKGGEGSATMTIAVQPDLSYVLTADATPSRQEIDQALQLIGFEKSESGLTYGATGVFKGV